MGRTPAHNAPVTAHTPVLLQKVIDFLEPRKARVVVDGTLGGGGHAEALVREMSAESTFLGCDRDVDALARATLRLKGMKPRILLEEANFRDLRAVLACYGLSGADALLLDLGYSSDQLEGAGRGFSFLRDEPLLMTLSKHPGPEEVTALDAVNGWSEESLSDVLYGFGGERHARRIARAIVEARNKAPLRTSRELTEVILSVVPRRGRLHPATRTFQALRIAVNDELGALEAFLADAQHLLVQGGRLAIISFHSLEDRLVKRYMRTWVTDGLGEVATKRPVSPTDEEIAQNPRARSAVLRMFTKY